MTCEGTGEVDWKWTCQGSEDGDGDMAYIREKLQHGSLSTVRRWSRRKRKKRNMKQSKRTDSASYHTFPPWFDLPPSLSPSLPSFSSSCPPSLSVLPTSQPPVGTICHRAEQPGSWVSHYSLHRRTRKPCTSFFFSLSSFAKISRSASDWIFTKVSSFMCLLHLLQGFFFSYF